MKQMAQTLNWLSDHGIQDFAELSTKVDVASAERRELLRQARAAEKRLNEISVLRKQVVIYARTRKVFEAWHDKRRNCALLRKDTFAFCRNWDVPNKQFCNVASHLPCLLDVSGSRYIRSYTGHVISDAVLLRCSI